VANLPEEVSVAESNSEQRGRFPAGCGGPGCWGISLLLFLALAASCTVAVLHLREMARSATCYNNLCQIGLALRGYHTQFGTFPPAYLCDKTGKPVNSWRTRIVPGVLSYNFPRAYDFTKPWDGPENSRLFPRKMWLHCFQCPSAGSEEPAITNYVAVVGPNTMWPGCTAAKQAAGWSDKDKILVIEVVNSDILWMEPRDLTLDQALDAICPKMGVGIGSRHRDGIHYVTVLGAVRALDPNIDRESLRRLLVRDTSESPAPRNSGK
jgi:hypothetical protein